MSGAVSATKRNRFEKVVNFKGVYYSFSLGVSGAYPVELYMALCHELECYSMVFLQDISKEIWLGVFVGQPRKSVVIPNNNLIAQIRRYKEIMPGDVIILNGIVDIGEKNSIGSIAIEKDPKLQDPDQKSKAIANYAAGAFVSACVVMASLYGKVLLEEKIADLESRRSEAMTKIANASILAKWQPSLLPSSSVQDVDINKLQDSNDSRFPLIQNGIVSWQ